MSVLEPADTRAAADADQAYRDILETADRYRDCRSQTPTITIDPPDAEEYDDAVSVERLHDDGLAGYRVQVHITDVPEYVEPEESLDDVLYQQAFTRYGPDDTDPLLPAELSEELSLREGTTRPVNTVEMLFDEDGRFQDHSIYKSLITVDRNLTYDEAAEYAQKQKGSADLPDAEEALVTTLEDLAFLTHRLEQADGRDTYDRETAHRIVEELMLKTNQLCARELQDGGAGIYRVHDPDAADDRATAPARYSTESGNHEGLSIEPYAHLTSPMRRYVDIMNWWLYWDDVSADEDDLAFIVSHINDEEDSDTVRQQPVHEYLL